jgi:hypothetical protein
MPTSGSKTKSKQAPEKVEDYNNQKKQRILCDCVVHFQTVQLFIIFTCRKKTLGKRTRRKPKQLLNKLLPLRFKCLLRWKLCSARLENKETEFVNLRAAGLTRYILTTDLPLNAI